MNDDQYLLASAYLDGELSPDDWARAAADPEVMAIVEQMQALAAAVAGVEPPEAAARDRAIEAALTELRPVVVPLSSSRRPIGAWLGVAAAVVAVLAVGAVVVSTGRGGDDDFDAAGDEASVVTADADIERSAGLTAGGEVADGDMAPAAEDMAEAPAPESAERAGDEEESMSEMVLSNEAGAALDAVPTAPPSAGFDPDAPLRTPGDLTAFGEHLLLLEAQGQLPPTPNTQCPLPEQVGIVDVLDAASYVVDDVTVPVLIALDRAAGLTLALEPSTCETIADNTAP